MAPLRLAGFRQALNPYVTRLSTATKPWPHCDLSYEGLPAQSEQPLSTATKPWPHCDEFTPGANTAGNVSPRLQSRGPIATEEHHLVASGLAPLHGYKAVAPLRRVWGCVCERLAVLSPRLQSRGPIATVAVRRLDPQPAALHGYKAVAPLRRSRSAACPPEAALSTATKPWPHCDEDDELAGGQVPGPLSTATKPWPHCDLGRS